MRSRAIFFLLSAPVAATLVATAPAALAGGEPPVPPAPERWVTDRAGALSPGAVAALDQRLGDDARATGHQALVYVDRTTGASGSW